MNPTWWLGNSVKATPSAAAAASLVRQVIVFRDSMPPAMTTRADAARTAWASGRYAVIELATPDSSGSLRDPSSSPGNPNWVGSGGAACRYSSVNSPCHEVSPMKAAIPAPHPRS